jgi:ribonuclease E
MAAANGRHEDETDDIDESARTEDVDVIVGEHDGDDAETDARLHEQVAREAAEEDLDDGDFDDDSDDTDEDDEVDLDDDQDLDDEDLEDEEDEDDEDLDLDDDLDLEDSDESDDGDDSDGSDDSDHESAVGAVTAPAAQPRRRRAAARPAGPPIHED